MVHKLQKPEQKSDGTLPDTFLSLSTCVVGADVYKDAESMEKM